MDADKFASGSDDDFNPRAGTKKEEKDALLVRNQSELAS